MPAPRLSLALVSLASNIAPRHARDRFCREWLGELCHRAAWFDKRGTPAWRARCSLTWRASGALAHAIALRWSHWTMIDVIRDLRQGWRALASRPAFTAIAAATLAIGIGLSAAMFAVVDALLLTPLPFRDPDRLVEVWETNPLRNWTHANVAPANLLDWQARTSSFEAFAYFIGSDTKQPATITQNLAASAGAERIDGMFVSGNFFSVLGAAPALGRSFSETESEAGGPSAVIISDGLWRRVYGADPAIVGRTIRIDETPTIVVGVMPAGFQFGTNETDYWELFVRPQAQWRKLRVPHFLGVIARLREGATVASARADLQRVASQLEREYPASNTKMNADLGPLQEWAVGDVRRPLLVFLGAVAFVLLIACANVAGLLISRTTERAREIAVRSALGASRLRLLREQLIESGLLAATGAILGLLVAWAGIRAFIALSPPDMPRLAEVAIDVRVLAALIGATTLTTVLCGLAPSLHAARLGVAAALRSGGRSAAGSGAGGRRVLVVAEVALAVVLVAGAGLLARSFAGLMQVDPGVRPERVVAARLSLPSATYDTDAKRQQFFERLLGEVRALPGVEAAGASTRLALEGMRWTGDLAVEGRPDVWGRELRHKEVTPGYFRAIGLPLVRGRDFTSADTDMSPSVVVINEALGRAFFDGVDPIGHRISYTKPGQRAAWRTVIGVVADERQDSLSAPVMPEVYDSHLQAAVSEMRLVVRTRTDGVGIAADLRGVVSRLDAGLAVFDIEPMSDVIGRSLSPVRFTTSLVGAFALVAVLLAGVGVYGLLSTLVGQRRREIGLRMALGAARGQVVGMLLGEAARLIAAGLAVGLVLAVSLRHALTGLLVGVSPFDPITFMGVALSLAAIGLLASLMPARRAATVDPMEALRTE
jgi:putative ABC transport system permease protein